MPRGQEPLLSEDRPSSDHSEERSIEEEDALLTGQQRPQVRKYGWDFWREVGLFAWATLATAIVIILAVMYQHKQTAHPNSSGGDWKDGRPSGKRNLIFMVSDGMGPTSLSLTRSFRQVESGLPIDDLLVLDQHLIGSSRTRSSSSLITDSAAGATAFSCGKKSYNGAISVLPDHTPCGTVLEAAKRAGYMTGLVVTTRITDATPACFAAHVNQREEEDRIAEQEVGEHPLGRMVDLMLGGGRCHFLPNTTDGSCRGDDRDIVELAKSNGFSYVDDRNGFDGLNLGNSVKLPLLGLFASTDIPYEIDRRQMDDVYPSLDEMARTALKALSAATKDSNKGFFLMIEGSRIDHAGHGNDPVAQVHEVIAYDKAFASVLDFLDKDDVQGVAISTSDHETGGLATARRTFKATPSPLHVHRAPLTSNRTPLHLPRIPLVPRATHQRYPFLRKPRLPPALPPQQPPNPRQRHLSPLLLRPPKLHPPPPRNRSRRLRRYRRRSRPPRRPPGGLARLLCLRGHHRPPGAGRVEHPRTFSRRRAHLR